MHLSAFAGDWAELGRVLGEMCRRRAAWKFAKTVIAGGAANLHCDLRCEGKSTPVHLWSDE